MSATIISSTADENKGSGIKFLEGEKEWKAVRVFRQFVFSTLSPCSRVKIYWRILALIIFKFVRHSCITKGYLTLELS